MLRLNSEERNLFEHYAEEIVKLNPVPFKNKEEAEFFREWMKKEDICTELFEIGDHYEVVYRMKTSESEGNITFIHPVDKSGKIKAE